MISVSPGEVERRFAVLGIPNRFSTEEHQRLITTMIVRSDENVIAFPTPVANEGLNLLTLRNLLGTDPKRQPSFFDHPWYLKESFAEHNCPGGWHYLYTDVLPHSICQPINYIDRLKPSGLDLPWAVEVALMLFLHYSGTKEQLMQKKHTWCRDLASVNRHVTVGAFGRNGLFVSGHPEDFTSRGLGICARVMS
jgi:hypothetical protein